MYVKRNRNKLTFSHIKGKILTVNHKCLCPFETLY